MAGENVLGNMVVRFTAETEGMREDIAAIKKQLGEMDDQTESSSLSMTEFNQALEVGQKIIGAVGDILEGTVGAMIDYGMEVKDVSSMLGVSSVEASTLIQVLDDLGVETSTLETAMRTMKENGMVPSMDTLKQLSAQYLALEDPVARSTFLFDNFGRSGLDMIRVMEAGPDTLDELAESALATGLVVGDDFVAQAEAGRVALDGLQDTWDGFVMMLSAEMLPGITAALEGFVGLTGAILRNTGVTAAYNTEVLISAEENVALNEELAAGAETYADYTAAAFEAGVGLMSFSEAEWSAQQATVAASEAMADQADNAMPSIIDMAGDLTGKFDEQKMAADLVSSGIEAMTDSYLEYERVMAVILLAQGKINAEEYNHRLEVINTLEPLENLNAAYQRGAVSEEEWIAALSDGTVTQGEVNALLGITSDGLSKVAQLMLTLDGAVADASVNIDINTTGNARGSLGSDIGNVNVDMFMADGGSFVATQPTVMMVGEAGPEYVNVTPADRAGGAQGMVVNINDRLAMKLWMDQQAAADRERLNARMG